MAPTPALREATAPQERDTRKRSAPTIGERKDFSLVLGGPLFQLLRRMHVSGDALELVRQRILAILAIAWLPLFVLSVLEGQAWDGRAAVPFLWDGEANIRFLVSMQRF